MSISEHFRHLKHIQTYIFLKWHVISDKMAVRTKKYKPSVSNDDVLRKIGYPRGVGGINPQFSRKLP